MVVTDDKGNVPVGHDSVVDASICMELLVLKLKYGPSFGHDQTKSQNVLQVCRVQAGRPGNSNRSLHKRTEF